MIFSIHEIHVFARSANIFSFSQVNTTNISANYYSRCTYRNNEMRAFLSFQVTPVFPRSAVCSDNAKQRGALFTSSIFRACLSHKEHSEKCQKCIATKIDLLAMFPCLYV